MNERIKTLLDQCTSHYQMTNEYGNDIEIEAVDQEKFAELIVQECATVSKNYAAGSMPLSISLAIKAHFGIKE